MLDDTDTPARAQAARTVAVLHIYRDGLHEHLAPDHRISNVGMVAITGSYQDALEFLRTERGYTILSEVEWGEYWLIGVQAGRQYATYAIEYRDVYTATPPAAGD